MKNKLVNKNVIRAISVGLAAVMASTPITAFAAEGENPTEGNDTEHSGQQSVTEPSEETKANEEVTDQLDEVKDDYKEEAAELGAAGDTDESGDYAAVAGEISDIEGGIDAVNKANDAAETEKEAYEKELAEANAALQEVDKAVSELETTDEDGNTVTIWEQAQDAAEVTGELAQDAADAADKAENATTRDEVNQAATDAQTAADAADAVSDELTEELATVDTALADAQDAVDEAQAAYDTAQAAADAAQAALDQLLLDNGLATQNEDGTLTILTDKVDAKDENGEYIVKGDVLEAIEAAQKIVESAKADVADAKTQMETATATLDHEEVALLKQIVELQDEINARKNYSDQTYWDKTKTMNEYLIRYQLLKDVEGLDYSSISFGKWSVDSETSSNVDNKDYVEVTYSVKAENGTTKTETKRFNYHKANNETSNANKGTSDIEVYEKVLETVVDKDAYSADENANGHVLSQTTNDDGTTTYQITKTDAEGNKTTEDVTGVVVEVTTTAENGTTKSEKLVSGDVVNTDVAYKAGTENGVTTTIGETTTSYTYEKVTVVDKVVTTESEPQTLDAQTKKSDMRAAVLKAFDEAAETGNQISITISGTKYQNLLHPSVPYSITYTSKKAFLEDYNNIPDRSSGDLFGKYGISVTTTTTTVESHEEYQIKETTTADVTTVDAGSYTNNYYKIHLNGEKAAKKEVAELKAKGYEASYKMESKLSGKYTITYSKTTTTTGATVSTTTYAVSDTFTSTDHAAVTHTQWSSTEKDTAYVTQVGVLNANKAYTDAKKAQAEATAKQTKADNLYQQLLDALENLKVLQKAKDVSSADLTAARAKVTELQDAYDDAQEAADKAEENAEQAQEAAERAAAAAENFTEPTTPDEEGDTNNGGATTPATDDTDNGTVTPVTPITVNTNATPVTPAVIPAATTTTTITDTVTPLTDTVEDTTADDDDTAAVPVVTTIADATEPLAAAPAATVQTATVRNAAANQTVQIADETTPLADNAGAAGNDGAGTGTEGTGDQEQASITITDEETPLVAIADEDQEKMSWWWLLIVAVLGATGYELYKKHQQKKAEQAQQQNIEQ